MLRYAVRRLLLMVVVLFGLSIITFGLTHIVPGDPARVYAGNQAQAEQVEAVRERYGFDKPLLEQYSIYMSGLAKGDLGMSLTTRRPVIDDLWQALPATIELTLAGVLLIVAIGIPLGVLTAARRGKGFDHVVRLVSVAGVSMPVFWLGILLQIVFFGQLRLLPVGGRLGTEESPPPQVTGSYIVDSLLAGDMATLGSAALHLVLPAVTMAAGGIALVLLTTRASALEVLDADYVRTARVKGLRERSVLRRHVLKNAMLPTTTVLGLTIGFLLGGNILVETVFNWHGMGWYAVAAIRNLDYAAIMGVTLVFAGMFVVVNLLVDLAYVLLDPRITYEGGQGR